MGTASLAVTREQILAFRRFVGGLDTRQRWTPQALRRATWAGLQDSMPRAAVLSLNARVAGTTSAALEDPALVQIWGPGYSVYVVHADDLAVFTIGRSSDDATFRAREADLATRLRTVLGGGSMPYGDAGRALGVNPNALRYATTTGSLVLRWDGARQPTIEMIDPPDVDPSAARCELARRHLHVFGPSTAESFARWAGIRSREAQATFDRLHTELIEVSTPLGTAWLLRTDEQALRRGSARSGSGRRGSGRSGSGRGGSSREPVVRLLPSGDAYFLLHGRDRELLVPDEERRPMLWTPRVWPGAVLVDGEVRGVWRRAKHVVTIDLWGKQASSAKDGIAHEAAALPIPDNSGQMRVVWAHE